MSLVTRDLSIIIVNWNTRDLLARCLESVILGTGELGSPITEVIVVDNASSDGSAAMVRRDFPGVQLIENSENVGFARANNLGIVLATGRYVLLLNSDTLLPQGILESLLAFADAHPQAGIVGAKLVNLDDSFQAGPNRFPTLASVVLESWGVIQRITRNPYYPSFLPQRSSVPQECDWVGGACLLARRVAIEQVGLLDEAFFMNSEEVDWCYRMRQGGWEVWYTPASSVIHLGGASANRSTAMQRIRNNRGKVLFLSKHHGALAGWLAQTNFRATSFLKAMTYSLRFVFTRNQRYHEQAASHWAVARETDWPQKY